MKMSSVTTSRFPNVLPIFLVGRSGFSKISSQQNWKRFRTHVIEAPSDNEHQLRQELWNFQQRHRGVLKGLIQSLPDIPYRHKQAENGGQDSGTEKTDMENEVADSTSTIPKLPDLVMRNSKRKLYRFSKTPRRKPRTKYFELKTKVDASTMTIPEEELKNDIEEQTDEPKTKKKFKRKKTKRTENTKPTVQIVQKQPEKTDRASQVRPFPKLKMRQRQKDENLLKFEIESFSNSSGDFERTDIPVEHVGPSSHGTTEHGWSTFSMVRKKKEDDAKVPDIVENQVLANETDKEETENSDDTFQRNPKQEPSISKTSDMNHSDADRAWFDKVLGDKDVFNFHHYNEFARARPDDNKVETADRKGVHDVDRDQSHSNPMKTAVTKTEGSIEPASNYPGEFNIAPRNQKQEGKSFPTFPSNGHPMKRIGLVQKKIKQAASKALLAKVYEGR